MRLICYATSDPPPKIVCAPIQRPWMENTPEGFAARCLPLNIANAHGWLILNTVPFTAEWNGDPGIGGITVQPIGLGAPMLGSSHFGSGVLTFHVTGLFRTEPGYDLMVTGPFNQPKDAIQPLSGVVETDWAPYSFTMNWLFTRQRTPVTFERDEPYCMIFPVKRGQVEEIDPVITAIQSDPEVLKAFTVFSESRNKFNADLKVPGSEARNRKWQKDYFRGAPAFGTAPADHRTKVKLKEFVLEPPG